MERATKFVAMRMSRELISTEMNWCEAIVAIAFTEEQIRWEEVRNFLPGTMPMVRGDYPHAHNDRNRLLWLYQSWYNMSVGPFIVAHAFQVGDKIVVPKWSERGDVVTGGDLYTVIVVRTQWTSKKHAFELSENGVSKMVDLAKERGYSASGRKQVGAKLNERAMWYRFKTPPVR